MCLNTWTFKPVNVDKISCTNCVLRWTWEGHHISATNPEKFENCIDVTINKSSGSGNGLVDPLHSSESAESTDVLLVSETTLDVTFSSGYTQTITSPSPEKTFDTPEPRFDDDSSVSQVKPTGSKSQGNSCSCDLSVDANIYSQCTADGNYCTCFSGLWSALGKVKMNCAPGTTCSQSGSQILCQ
jgi:hypothetical protein